MLPELSCCPSCESEDLTVLLPSSDAGERLMMCKSCRTIGTALELGGGISLYALRLLQPGYHLILKKLHKAINAND